MDQRPYRPGHLLRAFDQLKPADDLKNQIAALLGLPYGKPAEAVNDVSEIVKEIFRRASDRRQEDETRERPAKTEPKSTDALPASWRTVERGVRHPPSWLATVVPLPPQQPSRSAPKPESLWVPQWTRAILSATMASPGTGREIDWDHVIEAVALSRPLKELPYRKQWSGARSVQLLLDKGPSMLPFAEDRASLESEIRNLAGPGLEVLSFACCPSRAAGIGIRLRWKKYEELPPPRTGCTVLVISDLGIGHAPGAEPPATVDEWLAFAERVRSFGCRLTAIVPYTPARWPPGLMRSIDLVYWSRETTAAAAHRARRVRA